jgi:intracellular sulfur oxidation DsrE/DsrF family protein
MKPILFAFCLVFLSSFSSFLQAQSVPYNVVFDLTSKDTADHQAVMRWLGGISGSNPDAKLEVVLYGQSLDMVQKGRSTVAPALLQLLQNKNISVKVCAVAMKHRNLDASQLLPGVGIVPDGIYEIILRQKDGWGYIKAVH